MSRATEKQNCQSCKFFEHYKFISWMELEEGGCRRFPPMIPQTKTYKIGHPHMPPIVLGNMWCGEWKIKSKKIIFIDFCLDEKRKDW